MGWGRRVLLDELGRQHELAEHLAEIGILQQRLNKTAKNQASVSEELRRLTAENNELKLYVSTLFRLLLDKGLVTLEEVETLVSAIDREDGAEDGCRKGPVLAT